MYYAKPLQKLIDELNRLPGIGPKSAQRLALHILRRSEEGVQNLAQALLEVRSKIKSCSICNNYTEKDPCEICSDPSRDQSLICVVEEPDDLMACERTRQFKGLYHILGGSISPLEGINPEDLSIMPFLSRIGKTNIKEIILATNPNVEGEATALYIAKLIKPLGIKVTRLAHGLPVGGDLEFADEVTLSMALEGRTEI